MPRGNYVKMKFSKILWACPIFMLLLLYPAFSCMGVTEGNGNLMLQITTNKSDYMVGEPILIRLELINPTSDSITLAFRSSKIFDGTLWIYQSEGYFIEQIYDSSNCVFLPIITVIEIPPYSSYEILSINYSSSLEPDIYKIEAFSGNQQSETTVEVHAETLPEFSQLTILLVIVVSPFIALVYRKRIGRIGV